MSQLENAEERTWTQVLGEGPLVAMALHDGAGIRAELADLLALDTAERLREEDPFTGAWTAMASTRLICHRSRFEVDLNRPREKAVYRTPEDAWGLKVWTTELAEDVVARSLALYDAFYENARSILADLEQRYGRFVIFDLHTYNHRRDGPTAPPAPEHRNPQVNIGTGTMNRDYWAPVVDSFIGALRAQPFDGGTLDVRENVRFRGGNFGRWVHQTFPETGCVLSLEFKKFFMDEWTAEPVDDLVDAIGQALAAATPAVLEALGRINSATSPVPAS